MTPWRGERFLAGKAHGHDPRELAQLATRPLVHLDAGGHRLAAEEQGQINTLQLFVVARQERRV